MIRRILAAVAVAVLAATIALPAGAADSRPPYRDAQSTPTATPIKHFVTLMQENHSFDNYFGAYPGADGRPAGTCMPVDPAVPKSKCIKPYYIGGTPVVDLGHNRNDFLVQYNKGRLDGFVKAYQNQPVNSTLAMGYYDERTLAYYYNLADNYVLFDRFFTSAAGGSVWNHFYWVSATPGNPRGDTLDPRGFDHIPTIFDRLDAVGISWKFYIQNYDPTVTFRTPGNGDRAAQIVWAPVLNYKRFLDDSRLNSRIVSLDEYFTDLQKGTLPAVSFIVPSGASEHPPGSIEAGQRFVRTLINSLMVSSAWDSAAFTWTYDDWGGWYDHVRPPTVDAYGYGFRAPSLLVSAYARRGVVDHTRLDFTSQLKFIEQNWSVKPLASRDARANSIVSAFDFTAPPRRPEILATTRHAAEVPAPRPTIVYASYGGATTVAVALIAFSSRRAGSRLLAKRRRPAR